MIKRRLTINAAGRVVEQPYGPGRWHSSRVRGYVHKGCEQAAKALVAAGPCMDKAHNCCKEHGS